MDNTLKKEYGSLEELMSALSDEQQSHSRRVAEYMQVIYLQAVAEDIYPLDVKANARLKEEYRGMAYAAGMYHDAGKALVPEEYRSLRPGFSPEEVALYRKHAADSGALVSRLLKSSKEFKALELRYIEETVSSHHEKWDGSGFPAGIGGEVIPLIARMLSVADALDHKATETLSEHPFEDALEAITALAGQDYDPEVIKLFKAIRPKLKKIFNANISQSRAIPVTENFIRRTSGRAMCLKFRPIASRRGGKPFAYEAKMFFRDRQDYVEYDAVESIVRKNKQINGMGIYFILEACDALNRFKACSIESAYVALELPTGWLNRRGAWKDVVSAVSDEQLTADRLVIEISAKEWEVPSKTLIENITKLNENGIGLMFTGMLPSSLGEYEKLATDFRIESGNSAFIDDAAECEIIKQIKAGGARLIADGISKKSLQTPLNKLAVTYMTSPLAGDYIFEDELVNRELAAKG